MEKISIELTLCKMPIGEILGAFVIHWCLEGLSYLSIARRRAATVVERLCAVNKAVVSGIDLPTPKTPIDRAAIQSTSIFVSRFRIVVDRSARKVVDGVELWGHLLRVCVPLLALLTSVLAETWKAMGRCVLRCLSNSRPPPTARMPTTRVTGTRPTLQH